MTRSIPLGAVIVLMLGCQRRSETEELSAQASAKAEHVSTFWSTYQRATGARLDGRYTEAAEDYRRALELDPAHQDSLFYLAVSLEAEGFYREAIDVLRELVALYPEHGRGWSQLGAVLATRAPGAPFDLEGAEAAFRKSEAINPEHSGSFVARGELALERGNIEEAARLFGTAADMGSPEGLFDEGLVALLRGSPAGAMALFAGVFDKRAKERAITGKGASSEGDVDASKLTPLESATVRARAFAYWTSVRLGGYPDSVRAEDRLELSEPAAQLPVREVDGKAALADLDGDGRLEIIWCSESGLRSSGSAEPLSPARLDDVVAFDADGDGRVDLYGVGSEENVLLRNEGVAFEDVTAASGLGGERPTARAIAEDFDGDGQLDLVEVGEWEEGRSPVRFFLRRGDRYEDDTTASGLDYEGHLVDAAAADVNGDGALDLYLLGWRRPGRLFLARDGRFVDATQEAGLEGAGGEGPRALFFDFDRDGDPDLLVTAHAPAELSLLRLVAKDVHFDKATPRLFRNEAGRFSDITSEVGLDRAFGVTDATAADVDADGFVDLLFAEGGFDVGHFGPSVVLRNGEGRALVDWAYLPAIDAPRRATGITAGDLDGDGRPEVVLSVAGRLLR